MFDKSIEEIDKIVKSTLKDIAPIKNENGKSCFELMQILFEKEEQLHIRKLKNVLKDEAKDNTIVYVTLLVSNIQKLEINNYDKTRYLGEIAEVLYRTIHKCSKKKLSQKEMESSYYTLHKYAINEAIKTASIRELYGIARDCFQLTGDFEFAKNTYQKAIDLCYKKNNTSLLHLLGQNMYWCGTEYFINWGESIQQEAKRLSDKQKIKNKIKCDSIL